MNQFYKMFQSSLKHMWEEFRVNVLHKEKHGKQDIWHQFTRYVIMIPFDIIFAIIGCTLLIACLLLIAPIAMLFGFNLGDIFAEKQAALQAKLKPALWIPFFSKMHSAREKWNSVAPAETVFKNIMDAAKKMEGTDKKGSVVKIVETNRKEMWMKIYFFTRMKWLDVMEIKVEVGPDMGGAVIDAYSYSTGVAPLILPPYVAVFLSSVLFWIPFSDFGFNQNRLDRVRNMLSVETEKER